MRRMIFSVVMLFAIACAADAYKDAMEEKFDAPNAVEWQKASSDAIAAATTPEVLDSFTENAAAASALCSAVKPAYGTDPIKAAQIAAVSQRVMEPESCRCPLAFLAFWRHTRSDRRDIWTAALLDAAGKAADPYIATFLLDQLRWCGRRCQADAVRKIGAAPGTAREVKEMAALVAAELSAAER